MQFFNTKILKKKKMNSLDLLKCEIRFKNKKQFIEILITIRMKIKKKVLDKKYFNC